MSTRSGDRRTVVITQPMYFPWVGLFEQIRLADEIVWLDDVQLVLR
ncbi:MAG TPA: WbqC family protein, partial [Fibrobacteria bacterium]|nr:WbqC family protein [Fibrobacteria bacterium]